MDSEVRKTNFRWWICGLLFLATTINYVDRGVIGVLKQNLTKEFHWSDMDYANITAWFQFAYAGGYLFAGRLMDIIGVRRGYAISVTLWSLAAMATSFATSVFGFSVARATLGLAEGGNFPAAIKTVSEWFPKRERAFATGLFNAGSNIGAIVTPLVVPFLTLQFGWRSAFLVTGSLGSLWLIAWWILYAPPTRTARCNPAELAYIRSDPPDSKAPVSWLGLLRYRATWAYVVGTLLTSPIWWFYLFWVPDFLFKNYHVDLTRIGPPLVAVYLISDVGSIGGGWLSSVLLSKGWSLTASRKTALFTCALLVVPVLAASFVHSLWIVTIAIGLAAAGHQGWSANLYTLVSDTMPRRLVSSVVGMGGFCGSLVAVFFSKFVGYVLEKTHSYFVIFLIAPAAYLVGFAVIHLLIPKIEPAMSDS